MIENWSALPDPAGLPPRLGWMVLDAVCAAFRVSRADLEAPRKGKVHLSRARFAAAWLLWAVPAPGRAKRRSFPEIGRLLGGRDHSTMIHAVRRARELAAREPAYAALLTRLARGRAPRLAEVAAELASEPAPAVKPSALEQALAASVTRYGERVNPDDSDARGRAAGSLALAAAIAQARRLAA